MYLLAVVNAHTCTYGDVQIAWQTERDGCMYLRTHTLGRGQIAGQSKDGPQRLHVAAVCILHSSPVIRRTTRSILNSRPSCCGERKKPATGCFRTAALAPHVVRARARPSRRPGNTHTKLSPLAISLLCSALCILTLRQQQQQSSTLPP